MRINRSVIALGAAVAISVLGLSGEASAVPCNPQGTPLDAPYADTSYVGGAESCAVGPGSNEGVGAIESLLGLSDVEFANKWDWDEDNSNWDVTNTLSDVGFSLDPNPSSPVSDEFSGKWSVADNFWTLFSTLIIVQKDGGQDPGYWVAFVIAEDTVSGIYNSIFSNDNSVKAISHISAYVIDKSNSNVPDVPLPAALPLLGGGIAILGIVGMRKRRATKA